MKIRKRLFGLALSLCLCCSLLFCSAVEAFAWGVTLPEETPIKRVTILPNDFINAEKVTQNVYVYYSNSPGTVLKTLTPNLAVGGNFKSGGYFNSPYKDKQMVKASLPVDGEVYTHSAMETFFGVGKLLDIDISSVDIFFNQQAFAMEVPYDYASSHAPITFRMTVYYADSAGKAVAGPYFDVTQFVTREWNNYMVWQVYLSAEQCFAISRADVPSGYSLAGFGYRWFINGSFPEETNFYISSLEVSTFEPSNATTVAIEKMREEMSGDLEELGEEISGSMDAMSDQISGEIEEMGDQIGGKIEEMGDQISDSMEQQTEAQKGFFQQLGDRITGALETLGTKILDGIKALFIPEEGFFEEYFAQWDTWMEEHFGALYYPIDLMIEILNRFLNLEVPDTSTITFPEIRVGEHLLLESQQYTFLGDDTLPAIKTLYQLYRTIVIVIFVFALAALCWKKINAIMGGGE